LRTKLKFGINKIEINLSVKGSMMREKLLALAAFALVLSVLFAPQNSQAVRSPSHPQLGARELARQRAREYVKTHFPFISSPNNTTQKPAPKASAATTGDQIASDKMTSMGQIAHLLSNNLVPKSKPGHIFPNLSDDTCVGADEDCSEEGFSDGPAGGQAEMAIGVDPTGAHVVIGFNDTRGFALNPARLSGFAYSDDGGVNFTDGGQLPSATVSTIGGTNYPQVFGDPDIKFVPGGGGGQFIYASIMVKTISATGTAQTMCVHRSTDFGHTWTGPFEVTAATNPTGVLSGANARDAADKEFFDVDPDTGRVLLSWSNFTSAAVIPGGVEIRTTFSDNIMSATPPTWSAGVVLNAGAADFDTASVPRFQGGGSPNVFVAWSRTSNTTVTPYDGQGFNNIAVSKSTDNGATWSASPLNLRASYFFPPDYILGNDRTHAMPSMAVDNSGGPRNGNIYVVYGDNTNKDGEDIAFQKSTDAGVTFSPTPILLDARPGSDRPQWFPFVTVDQTSGRVWVSYFDEGVGTSGDWMQTTALYSDDGGVTWTRPFMLSDRPFHGGYGNDTGQPNLGDYIGSTVVGGNIFATWGGNPPAVLFTEGNATGQFPYPDFYFKKTNTSQAAIDIPDGVVSFFEGIGGTTMDLYVPLRNTTTNASLSPATYTGVSATLSTTTPNVSISGATRAYPSIAAGATQSNASNFALVMAGGFVQGTKIDLSLSVTTAQGNVTLPFQVNTGQPVVTNLVTQNFDATPVGSLPAGWTNVHTQGANTVAWSVGNHLPKTNGVVSNGAFHANANDGTGGVGDPTRDERLSFTQAIPAGAQFVTVDFDIAYDTEDSPDQKVLAYDGSLLRTTDAVAGFALIAEAYADQIVNSTSPTVGFFHYPKHFPRSGSTRYLQDMSAWAGDSGGYQHVHMLLPGMAGRTVIFRWDFVQDGGGICSNVRAGDTNCGVLIDNIVINSLSFVSPTAADGNIGGTITDSSGAPLGGVTINLSDTQSREAITDADGKYSFDGVETNGFYTVTPSSANYTFSPENRSFSLLGVHTEASFTATANNAHLNPLDANEFFVRQHYLDFLNREPDPPGLAGWLSTLNNCAAGDTSCDRVQVSEAFYRSQEFQQRGYFIYRFYSVAFGQKPDYAAFAPDLGRVSGFLDNAQLEAAKTAFIDDFTARPAFARQYDSLSDTAFVDKLLQTAGVDLSSRRQELIDALRTRRLRRAAVLREIAESSEVYQKYYNQAFVVMEYFGYLHRDPDALYTDWIRALDANPADSRRMVEGFVNSAEYRNRFVP
jgi:Carboxypeptidase regulatory-like domain/Domain of unknown function (DUF4214)